MPSSSSAAVRGSTVASRSRAGSAASSTGYDEQEDATFLRPPQVLARKLTCSVLTVVFMGGFLIILLQVGLTLTAVPDWSADAKQAMIDLEQENILKLASDKADYVDEIFGRVKEGLLQLREFAEQALVAVPQTIVVDQYLMGYPGLEQSGSTWDHSSWFLNGFGVGEVPEAESVAEGLLNRSSLMDVPFRAMQRQHQLVYLAALEDPSAADGTVSDINMQGYPGADIAGYLEEQEECNYRATEYAKGSSPSAFDPRCRPWYQDAVENDNTEVIFTNPYEDVGSGELIVTVAAAVYDSDAAPLLGVVGIDMDFTDIDNSIKDLRVIDSEGYAYLLAPGGKGEVAVHKNLQSDGGTQLIRELESGVDAEEFDAIVKLMSESCTGFETYSRDGDIWMLSWSHETTSVSNVDKTNVCGDGGFIAAVTVNEATLLEAFSKLESEVPNVVAVASAIMALVLVAISCVTGFIARSVSIRITKPVNQLTEVVHALNTMDFSRQGAGTWMVSEISCPELEELLEAFESMVVKFANVPLEGGDIKLAKQNYVEALIFFKKLQNDRGVGIVNNNLGNVFTLQARELSAQAAGADSKAKANTAMKQANEAYLDAETNYRLAIKDARMLCTAINQRNKGSFPLPKAPDSNPYSSNWEGGDSKSEEHAPTASSTADVESGGANPTGRVDENDLRADTAAFLQLANREFNLALCFAAKASSNAAMKGGSPDHATMQKARKLILGCVHNTADVKDSKSSQRQVEFLLELAAIERDQEGGHRAAAEAIHAAERVVADYSAQMDGGGGGDAERTLATTAPPGESPPATVSVLRQQLLAARGALCVAEGNPIMAIGYWTSAVIDCGDRMDVRAVRASLEGLRGLASSGRHGGQFPSELLVAVGLPQGEGKDSDSMKDAIDNALARVERLEAKAGMAAAKAGRHTGKKYSMTNVDLCFVMDCTGSMQSWIDQAKNKLMGIIEQAKKDVVNLNLRVAFVGYRDFGDSKRFEGPFDFCGEDELPGLLAKLGKIRAYGGDDVPEDVAGGLKLATELSWNSPTRLCILIADAPCHGQMFHGSMRDRYPNGCPSGLNPSSLLYNLKYEQGVDLYFVSITRHTDIMINALEDQLYALCQNNSKKLARARPENDGKGEPKPKIVVHELGSNDNRFLETVVKSLKLSINLRMETYS